jgi:glycerophosphoryl diester phosphodiesterase
VSLVAFTRRGVRRAAASGLDGVVSYQRSTTRRLIAEARALDLFVAPWTVNQPDDMDFFVGQGIDIIITDLPHVLTDRLERRELDRAREVLGGLA